MSSESLSAFETQQPISNELIFKGLRRLITTEANQASILTPSELDLYLEKHPEENFLLRMAIEAYVLTHGLRLVDDKLISASIREGREFHNKNGARSWFVRVGRTMLNLDKKEATALICEHERLAAEVVAFETQKLKLERDLVSIREKAEIILETSKTEAQKRAEGAETKAKELISEAGARSERMLESTLSHIEAKHREKSQEIKKLEKRLSELGEEIKIKQALVAEVSQNPDIMDEWKRLRAKQMKKEPPFYFEQKLQDFQRFYQSHNINLPPNFADQIRDIWENNTQKIEQAIEQNGFDDMLLLPGGIPLPELNAKMTVGYKPTYEGDNFKAGGSFALAKSQKTDKPRLVLVHKTQNLRDRPETLNIQGQDVKQDQILTLEDYLIFQRKYFEETKKHLDEVGWTWLATTSGARLVGAAGLRARRRSVCMRLTSTFRLRILAPAPPAVSFKTA